MDPKPGHMYTLKVWIHSLLLGSDVYQQPFGVRTITWNTTSLMVNDRPFYFRGFGKHEDSNIRGKGVDLPLITRYLDITGFELILDQ